ncbi:MAG: Y-family DNA polymerase [Propionibacteriaceae bacterium]|jgi:DNA polymerase V|nr:Y-family DNA polymerase [Propionibacteriaceae bacterium]
MNAIALVDVRCMYVSCERMADPALKGRPVVVLSNNDGCVISRSDEAKRVGVRMGEPWFKAKSDPRLRGVIARSSNYELYGDLSARFHRIIADMSAWTQVYSIDEAFVALNRTGVEHALAIQERVHRYTDLPTAAGVGPTKTLAKIAQTQAKAAGQNLCDLTAWSQPQLAELLQATPVGEVWGVGRRLARKLEAIRVRTALELSQLDPIQVRSRWSVMLERTVRELAGTPCISVHCDPQPRQQILYSRMMDTPITERGKMRHALAQYAWQASRRLRSQRQAASLLQVWLSTSRFREQPVNTGVAVALSSTDDPAQLIRAAQAVLPKMEEGQPYNRIAILLAGLSPAGTQPTLFDAASPQTDALNQALDRLNLRFPHCVGPGVVGIKAAQSWDTRHDMLSPAATTRWDELMPVYACVPPFRPVRG